MNKKNVTRISYGIYFLIAICFIFIRMLSSFGAFEFLGSFGSIVFTLLVQVVLLAGGSIFLFSKFTKNKIKDTLNFFNFKKISWKSVLLCGLMGIVVFFLNVFASSFFNSIISWFGYCPNQTQTILNDYPIWLLILNLIFTAILPGVCEEVAHRGMILSSSKKLGRGKAILISAVLFGLLHLNIQQVFYATLIGLFLGYLTIITGSIYPAMIVHFMNNALSVFLTYSSVKGYLFAKIFLRIEAIFENSLIIGILFVLLFVIILLYILFRLTARLFFDTARERILKGKKLIDRECEKQNYFNAIEIIKDEGISQSKHQQLSEKTKEQILDFFGVYKVEKLDQISKVFLSLCIVFMSIITIFTFIWGIL